MAFVQFEASSHYEGASYSARRKHTVLMGKKRETPSFVFCVDDFSLLEFDEKGIKYKTIKESELPEWLSEEGLAYFKFLKKKNPEGIYLNDNLPPLGYVSVLFKIDGGQREKAREILDRYNSQNISVERKAFCDLSVSSDLEKKLHVQAFVKECDFGRIFGELAEERIAGYDEYHKIFRTENPDRIR